MTKKILIITDNLPDQINGVVYMNDGDWVESCTALVEHHNGKWEIITWTKEKDDESSNNIEEDVQSVHQPW